MHRSRSLRKVNRRTPSGRHVIRYKRKSNAMPHCALCGAELNGIGESGGKSRRSTSRLFGGVLCSSCTANIIKLGSRIEHGDMKLNDISIREKQYVLQLVAH